MSEPLTPKREAEIAKMVHGALGVDVVYRDVDDTYDTDWDIRDLHIALSDLLAEVRRLRKQNDEFREANRRHAEQTFAGLRERLERGL